MDVVVIDGVEYIKASELARQFKYTADYVGQLCRGRKVDAKLIGRTWYVSPLSLTNHKTGRYTSKSQSDDKTNKIMLEAIKSRQNVSPVIRKSTAKSVEYAHREAKFSRHIGWSPARYEEDDSDLLPQVEKSQRSIAVNMVDATTLRVTESERPTRLEPEPMPEVALGGTLHIASLDEVYDLNPEDTKENIDISNNLEVDSATEQSVPVPIRSSESRPPVVAKTASAKKRPVEIPESKATYEVAIREIEPEEAHSESVLPNFTPERLRRFDSRVPSTLVVAPSPSAVTGFGTTFFVYGALAFVAVLALFATAFLEVQVTANSIGSSAMIAW